MAKRRRVSIFVGGEQQDSGDEGESYATKDGHHKKGASVSIAAKGPSAPWMSTVLTDVQSRVSNNPHLQGQSDSVNPLALVIHRDAVKDATDGKHTQPVMAFAFPGTDNASHWYMYRLDGLPEGKEDSVYADLNSQLAQLAQNPVLDHGEDVHKQPRLDAHIELGASFGKVLGDIAGGITKFVGSAASIASTVLPLAAFL
jgi:hypothetical protein